MRVTRVYSCKHLFALGVPIILALSGCSLRADQLQMQNGDRYEGKIVSVTSNAVVLQSDVLGRVTLPRAKVSALTFGSARATNAAPMAAPTAPTLSANSSSAAATNTDLSTAFRNLGANTNFIQQVRQQMLTGADPAASRKYDELVGGLMSGKLTVNDLRNEAKASIDQINELKRELGPEASDSLDSYLSILQNFVNETAPAVPAPLPSSAPAGGPAAGSGQPHGQNQ